MFALQGDGEFPLKPVELFCLALDSPDTPFVLFQLIEEGLLNSKKTATTMTKKAAQATSLMTSFEQGERL